jgi:hypothetical protein
MLHAYVLSGREPITNSSVAISNKEHEVPSISQSVETSFFYGGERGSNVHDGAFWQISSRCAALGVGLFGALADG